MPRSLRFLHNPSVLANYAEDDASRHWATKKVRSRIASQDEQEQKQASENVAQPTREKAKHEQPTTICQ